MLDRESSSGSRLSTIQKRSPIAQSQDCRFFKSTPPRLCRGPPVLPSRYRSMHHLRDPNRGISVPRKRNEALRSTADPFFSSRSPSNFIYQEQDVVAADRDSCMEATRDTTLRRRLQCLDGELALNKGSLCLRQ